MSRGRVYFAVCGVRDRVYVFGGKGKEVIEEGEYYRMAENKWKSMKPDKI
jgi:hypothetical protein